MPVFKGLFVRGDVTDGDPEYHRLYRAGQF